MDEFPIYEPTAEGQSAETVYWAAEDRRHQYAEWAEQQAAALAEEAEMDQEEG